MNAVFLHHRADKAGARRFTGDPVSAFAVLARIEAYRPAKRSLIRFEYAAWSKNGSYLPEFEYMNRRDAAKELREMRQRVKEGALMFKTSDGYYFEGQA